MHPLITSGAAHITQEGKPVHFGVDGVLGVVARYATKDDLARVAADIGRVEGTIDRTPDIDIRFVDRLTPGGLGVLDGGSTSYGDDGVYLLDSRTGRPAALVSQGARWGQARIVCSRSPGRVPFLASAVDLSALRRGWAPVHGSAWVTAGGKGVLLAGWAHSGKTGALLMACEKGATPIGDDRILLSADGAMTGVGRPVGVKAWHKAQLRMPALGTTGPMRILAGAATEADTMLRRAGGWPLASKVLGRVQRSMSSDLSPDLLGARPGRVRVDALILLETHAHGSIRCERADPADVPRRLAAQTEVELLAALRTQASFKYARSDEGWRDLQRAPEVARHIFEDATGDVPAYIVRHPYPCSLTELGDAVDRIVAET